MSLNLPEVEPLDEKIVPLLFLDEVLQDLQSWKDGLPDHELQEELNGPVDVTVLGYELVYERPLAPKEDFIAVPVYEFKVELQPKDGAPNQGTWRVVAAAEIDLPALRAG
jgi:hypothetical protein